MEEEERSVVAQLDGVGLQSNRSDRQAVSAVLPEIVAPGLPDEETLVAERDRFLGEINHLKMQQQELETMLDLQGVVLDLSDEQHLLDQLVRSREIKKRATRIITTARTRMIDTVLPV